MKPVQLVLTLALLLGLAVTANAQTRGSRRYIPPRPTLSPWLDLQRSDNDGPLDNYHTFVRPKQRTYESLGRQGYAIQQQRQALYGLGAEVSRMRQRPMGMRPTGVRPTGTNSTFMNYSHYFPLFGGR